MKPAPFDHVAPHSVEQVLDVLAERGDDAKLLAGGQSLLPVLNFRLAQPATLIDLNGVEELSFVRDGATGGLRTGALTRQSRLERDPRVAARVPLLAEALPHVAHPQIRARGTIGGSLAHADPAAELPAVACALGARLLLRRKTGERWVEARDFFRGLFSTALEPDELLVEIEWPAPPARTGCSFREFARRHGDYALAGVASTVRLDEDRRCEAVRVVFFALGDTPIDAGGAATELVGHEWSEERLLGAARAAAAPLEPNGDIHASAVFKRHLSVVMAQRALREAGERALRRVGGAR